MEGTVESVAARRASAAASVISDFDDVEILLTAVDAADGGVVHVLGHSEIERVISYGGRRREFLVRGCGVTRVLGTVRESLLAEICDEAGPRITVFPAMSTAAPLSDGDVAVRAGTTLCILRKDRADIYDVGESVTFSTSIALTGPRPDPSLVKASRSDRVMWMTAGDDGPMLTELDIKTANVAQFSLPFTDMPIAFAASGSGGMTAALGGNGAVLLAAAGSPGVEFLGSAVCPPEWVDDTHLAWMTREWPTSVLNVYDVASREVKTSSCGGWIVARLVPVGGTVSAIATAPGHPPRLVALDELSPTNARLPAVTTASRSTTRGPLRTIGYPPVGTEAGLAVFLRGGPAGEWLPTWDPMVELFQAHGFRVHQVESPYTAAIQRRMPYFRRGDFGVEDARLVAEAVDGLVVDTAGDGRLVFVGHSYGAYLAARAQEFLSAPAAALVTMNGPWTTRDLVALASEPQAQENRGLQRFLSQAFDLTAPTPEPEAEVRAFPPHWLVTYNLADPVVPPSLLDAAVERDRPAAVLRIAGEGHIPKKRASVRKVLTALSETLERIAECRAL